MLSLMLIGFGLYALSMLKITLFPSLNIPVVAISVGYRDAAPEDIGRIIVEPIEGAVSAIEGIETLDSNVRRGSAFIILRLKPGINVKEVELNVREAIDRIRAELPREVRQPTVFQFDPENRPIIRLSIESQLRGLDELRNIAVKTVEPLFERVPGVASADTRGGVEREIKVQLDPRKMAQYNLLPATIENAIRSNNVQVAAGDIVSSRRNYAIRAISMYESIPEIQNTIVTYVDSKPVRVKDVAKVEDGFAEVETLVEVNGNNSVNIEIQKQSDANTVDVAAGVLAAIPEIEAKLPPGIKLVMLSNEGEFIQASIDNLSNSAFQALLFVIVILLLFMGGWRSAFIVAVSIPISITITFLGMYAAGLTLNIISITGLALAVGMLVDNSIVVVESVAGKLEEGCSLFEAALQGTSEVSRALIGATLTTLAVFVPILGLTGFSGQLARDLAMTICIAIACSFATALLVIPVATRYFMKEKEFEKKHIMLSLLAGLEAGYAKSLRFLVKRLWLTPLIMVIVLVTTYGLFTQVRFSGFPQTDSGELDINIELPTGTKLTKTASVVRDIAAKMQKLPEVETVIASIGQRGFRQETNRGQVSLKLVPVEERESSTDELALRVRRQYTNYAGAEINVRGGGGFGPRGRFGGGDIRFTLIGNDMEIMKGIVSKVQERLMQEPDIVSAEISRNDPAPELQYLLDRERISRTGLTVQTVANALKSQTQGTQAGEFRADNREIPILVRLEEDAVQSREKLMGLTVGLNEGFRLPVKSLGYVRATQGVSGYQRRDRENVMDISVQVKGNANEKRAQINQFVQENISLPEGYRFEFSGSAREDQQSNNELLFALIAALLLTYMVMAAQFENFSDPFVIIFSIPLAFMGSLLLLWATGTDLSVPASIGVVILIGIVVNNGIVLVDYIHQRVKQSGDPAKFLDVFTESASRRLRPIILTAATTISSMIPLALEVGSGAETWSPLARSVIGGLTVSTVMTLFVVPGLLILLSTKRRRWVRASQ